MNIFTTALCLIFLIYSNVIHGIEIIRDSETEFIIKKLSLPLFKAANIDTKSIQILIVNDDSINAYVIDNNHIFINYGLLKFSEEPYTILGVIAHELGHITGKHILHMENHINNLNLSYLIGITLGLFTSITLTPEIGNAILLGSKVVGNKIFLRNTRIQEEIADQYAFKYLDEARYNIKGLINFLQYSIKKQVDLKKDDEYFLTHPLSIERLILAQNYKRTNEVKDLSQNDLMTFKRVVEKLNVSFSAVNILTNQYNFNRFSDYAKSIIFYRTNKTEKSLQLLSNLIKKSPEDPYFYELRAQILHKIGRIEEAIQDYREALKLSHDQDNILIKVQLSQALLTYHPHQAATYLEQVVSIENNNTFLWKQLAIAYGKSGNLGMSYFALATKSFLEKNEKLFIRYFNLAKNKLPDSSNLLIKLNDMMMQIKEYKKY